MQLNELAPKHKQKKSKRIGRGGKRGTYSGRGLKGQKSRSGRRFQPIIRQVIKRYPKLRGYRSFVLENYSAVVNIDTLEKISKIGEIISPNNLIKKGIIRMMKGKVPKVKILGRGKLSKQLIIENCKVSKTAKEAIEKAGGKIK